MDPPSHSPRLSQSASNTSGTSQKVSSPPPADYEMEREIDAQRDNALRSTDPNMALSWAEKVYMSVSISLEEYRREQEIAASDTGIAPRIATPPFESGLRNDCVSIVEKFAKQGHPKAVYPM
jgi:hypothetical protein